MKIQLPREGMPRFACTTCGYAGDEYALMDLPPGIPGHFLSCPKCGDVLDDTLDSPPMEVVTFPAGDPEFVGEKLRQYCAENGGYAVYENHVMDSSSFGERSIIPYLFTAMEDDALHVCEWEQRPDGGLPSRRRQLVGIFHEYPHPMILVRERRDR